MTSAAAVHGNIRIVFSVKRGNPRSAGAVSHRHSIMTQKGVDLRLAPAEGNERFERGTASAGREHFASKAGADFRIEHAALLERLERVGGKDLRPFVTVVSG